jgi:enamine deaminase RidA (YjgF/YER057c/UK114 family)
MIHDVLQPEGWAAPRGYANGIAARGRQVYVAGQVGWDAQGRFTSDSFIEQVRQALRNVVAVLAAAGGRPEHLVRLTWYVTSRDEYLASLPELGRVYREVLGRNYPAMAAVQVVALMEARAKVEIEATAVIPDPTRQD